MWLVLVISIFAFLGGAIAAVKFCDHYARAPLAPIFGVPIEQGDANQIKTLESRVEENPANVEAWTSLGNLYFDTDQYEKAIAAYLQSLQLDPRDADVWTDIGIMYRRNGEPDKAIEAFERAIKEDPKHENARLNKGVVLMHDLNDREGAIQAWEALLEVNPLATAWEDQLLFEIVLQYKAEPQSGSDNGKEKNR